MKRIAKEIAKNWLTPMYIVCFILGTNSMFGAETVFSFNIIERVVPISLPAFGVVTGWLLITFPIIPLLISAVKRLYKMRTKELPTEEQDERESKKTSMSVLSRLVKMGTGL